MFTGLSAFPLTPMKNGEVDEPAFIRLIDRLARAKVDSIGALGSTGNYAYLTSQQREKVTRLAVEHAAGVPVFVSISALCSQTVLQLADQAQQAGVSAVMLAPMSYQPLLEHEVYALYDKVTQALSVPLVIYDNPRTTNFHFSEPFLAQVAHLPGVASIKMSGLAQDAARMHERLAALRSLLPAHITLGVSGDPYAVAGLQAGCDLWFSVIGGLFPKTAQGLLAAVRQKDAVKIAEYTTKLEPIWAFFASYGGGLRTTATIAELLGLASGSCMPAPLKGLPPQDRDRLAECLTEWPLD